MTERFLAVDVGGSRIKSAIIVGEAVEEQPAESVASGLEPLVRQIVGLYKRAAAGAHLAWGLCMPGLIDSAGGVVRYSASLDLRDAPVLRLLGELPPPRVFVNDLVAAAAGEAAGGTLGLLQVGTGIAGRFVMNGRVATGVNGYAGEVGHLQFRRDGRVCSCGRRGCAEAYGGWGAIRRRYQEAGRPVSSPRELLDEARSDPWAAEVLADAFEAIGFAASALVAVHDPGTVRLGGGLAQAWSTTLTEAVRNELARNVLSALESATRVETTVLGDRASLIGLHSLSAGRDAGVESRD